MIDRDVALQMVDRLAARGFGSKVEIVPSSDGVLWKVWPGGPGNRLSDVPVNILVEIANDLGVVVFHSPGSGWSMHQGDRQLDASVKPCLIPTEEGEKS